MIKRWLPIFLFSLFILATCAGVVGLISLKQPFQIQDLLTFNDTNGDQLQGTYIPGTEPIGVIMLEGFGSDQIAMRPAASVFLEAGAHILTFDFSGHGRSAGALGFDNAATDRLAYQAMAAKETFKSISGLENDQILYCGHSLGGRVALQSAVLDPAPPRALILLGTQVNLGTNIQAEFFTGTSDSDLDWVQSLSSQVPETDIFLLSGSWDDILTPQAAQALYEKLTLNESGANASFVRELTIIPALVHNYEIYSTRLLRKMAEQLEDHDLVKFPNQISLSNVYFFWALTLIGLTGALSMAPGCLSRIRPLPTQPPLTTTIIRLRRFLWGKFIFWLPALPVSALLAGLFFFVPLYLPVFNMIYIGFIGGYGLLMLILYLIGKTPGTDGKWQIRREKTSLTFSFKDLNLWLGGLIWVVILATMILFTRTGFFYVIAANQRLLWLLIFSPITALGFWIGERETKMVEVFRHESGRTLSWVPLVLSLIGLMPFFIYTVFMGILGSISGMIGGLQSLLILGIVLLTGKVLSHFIHRDWIIAILQAVLLYALVLPQGVLFAI